MPLVKPIKTGPMTFAKLPKKYQNDSFGFAIDWLSAVTWG
ncbi:MAG: Hypothetical protein AJITA_00467 [Acetilactobacillus jinshanensis]